MGNKLQIEILSGPRLIEQQKVTDPYSRAGIDIFRNEFSEWFIINRSSMLGTEFMNEPERYRQWLIDLINGPMCGQKSALSKLMYIALNKNRSFRPLALIHDFPEKEPAFAVLLKNFLLSKGAKL